MRDSRAEVATSRVRASVDRTTSLHVLARHKRITRTSDVKVPLREFYNMVRDKLFLLCLRFLSFFLYTYLMDNKIVNK